MDNKIFKALVIDDEDTRNTTYHNVLDDKFQTEIINDLSKINKRMLRQFDLLVIDVCLSKNVNELTAFKIMDDYKIMIPTVLVSGEWIKSNGEPNSDILRVPQYKNVIKLVSWNELNKDENNMKISEEIYYAFCKARNISTDIRKDKCTILHLSDLQFGGNEAGATCNDNKRLASYLKERQMIPDIVLITGDIADKGLKKEYLEAKEWIDTLIKEVWEIDGNIEHEDRKKIILVPGNHDYDISLSASDIYSFIFSSSEKDAFIKKNEQDIVFTHQKLGLSNYFEFAFEVTGDDSWKDFATRAIHINSRFLNLGLCFVLLNSAYNINCRNCENKNDEFYCDLSKFLSDDLKYEPIISEEILNILVMHNPPKDYQRETDAGEKSKNVLQTIIEDNHSSICFYGHSHDYVIPQCLGDSGGEYCENMICVSAPTYRLAAASRTEDAMRGFNIVELERTTGDRYNRINVKNYEVIKANIKLKKEKTFPILQ